MKYSWISPGEDQVYVEDCQVCCRPNTIHIHIDVETRQVLVENEQEG
jgi:hypothetical protein